MQRALTQSSRIAMDCGRRVDGGRRGGGGGDKNNKRYRRQTCCEITPCQAGVRQKKAVPDGTNRPRTNPQELPDLALAAPPAGFAARRLVAAPVQAAAAAAAQ
jgi:hypothetical protein